MNVAGLLFAVLLCLFSSAYAADPEFDGECSMGLSVGKKLATDCSVFWVGPDDKLYCFFNQAAKEKFTVKLTKNRNFKSFISPPPLL